MGASSYKSLRTREKDLGEDANAPLLLQQGLKMASKQIFKITRASRMGSVPRVHFQSGSNPIRNVRINESSQLSDHLLKTPTGIENGHNKVHQIKPILRIKETNSDKKAP